MDFWVLRNLVVTRIWWVPFPSVEIEALVDKYLADHPALWRKGMHALAANAITDSCPDYSKELRKSDFWRRALEQSKPPA
jgi:hypothetical protein